MRNALTQLAETVKEPEQRKVRRRACSYPADPMIHGKRAVTDMLGQLFETEMDNFFSLFRRYLNDKAKSNEVYVYARVFRCSSQDSSRSGVRPACEGREKIEKKEKKTLTVR